MDKYEVAALADDYYTKKQRRDMLAMMAVPADPEEARRRAIEFHVAEAECFEAYSKLQTAKCRI